MEKKHLNLLRGVEKGFTEEYNPSFHWKDEYVVAREIRGQWLVSGEGVTLIGKKK